MFTRSRFTGRTGGAGVISELLRLIRVPLAVTKRWVERNSSCGEDNEIFLFLLGRLQVAIEAGKDTREYTGTARCLVRLKPSERGGTTSEKEGFELTPSRHGTAMKHENEPSTKQRHPRATPRPKPFRAKPYLCRRASSMSHMHPSSSPSRGLRLRESSELEAAANMSGVGRSESLSWDCDSCSFSCSTRESTHTNTNQRHLTRELQ